MNKEIAVKNLILGGGLSGLSCAYYLKNDYLILEKDSTPGGYCRTIPNFYHFQTEKYKKLFQDLVEKDQIIKQKKNTKIYYKSRLIDYPFQTNIHELEKIEFIECLYDLYFRDRVDNYDNFLDMLYVKFGKAITEKFLRPYNEKLYAVDLKLLDKDAMGRFFPYADFEQVMKNMGQEAQKTYNDEFMYLKKGTGYFIDKLYGQLDNNKIRLNCEVKSIDRIDKRVEIDEGEIIRYDNLISTIPYKEFLSMLKDDEGQKIKNLSYNKVLVLNLGFDKPSPNYIKEHWVYFPDKELNFYRIGFYNNILGDRELNVYVEIGFKKDDVEINEKEELRKTLNGMKAVGIITDEMRLVDKNILLMDPAYVHIENEENVKKNIMSFENDSIYMLGRYGRWTYNSMEDCIELADKLAQKLKNKK